MLKLIKLEWKKHSLVKQIRNVTIITACLCLLGFVLYYAIPTEDVKDMPPNLGEMLFSFTYIVFTTTTLASFVISAYQNKTMNVIFMYPIKRQKILAAQMISTWIISFISMIVSYIIFCGIFLLCQNFLPPRVPLAIDLLSMEFYLNLLLKSFLSVCMGFLGFFVGMRMKSVSAAIVTSVIVISLLGAQIGNVSLQNNIYIPIALTVVSFICAFFAISNIEKKDLM